MNDQQWYVLQAGQRVGPFTRESLRQLASAGMIQPATMLLDSEGSQLGAGRIAFEVTSPPPVPSPTGQQPAVKEALSLPPLPRTPPPPPPPPPGVPLRWLITKYSGSQPLQAWDPRLIGWLSLVFSPVWGGIMAALNARRLGMSHLMWRPVLTGVGSAVLYLVVSSIFWDWYIVNLALYVSATWLIWHLDLQPQVEPYQRLSQPSRPVVNWLVPVLGGLPAALLTLLMLVIVPLQPLGPREICDQFLRSNSLQQTKSLTTANLWPALIALDQLDPTVSTGTYEFAEEGDAPAEAGGYLVAYRSYAESKAGAETVQGVFHLVGREGRWKIEEVYFTGVNGQAADEWLPLSRSYEQIVAAGRSGRTVASIQPVASANSANGSQVWKTLEHVGKNPGMLSGLKTLLASGTAKKIGVVILALFEGVSALCRPKK